MRPGNELANIVLFFLVAIFILHLIEGDAVAWVKSKFAAVPTPKPASDGLAPFQTPPGGNPNQTVPNPIIPGAPPIPFSPPVGPGSIA